MAQCNRVVSSSSMLLAGLTNMVLVQPDHYHDYDYDLFVIYIFLFFGEWSYPAAGLYSGTIDEPIQLDLGI